MKVLNVIKSSDNTKKYYFGLSDSDQFHVEACLLHLKRYGYIICVSSQIGCMQKCVFCVSCAYTPLSSGVPHPGCG